MVKSRLLALIGASVAIAVPAYGHHTASMFAMDKEVVLNGTVKEFQYTNPHSWLLVDVTKDGATTTWGFEAEGPTTLRQMGVRPADFTPGTKVTVTGHPMRDGRPAAAWTKAVRADGKEFYPRGRQNGS